MEKILRLSCVFLLGVLFQLVAQGNAQSGNGSELTGSLINASTHDILSVQNFMTCVRRDIPGLLFYMRGRTFNEIFICPNGLISLRDRVFQSWPYVIGTLPSQLNFPFLAPYWTRVDLNSFRIGESRIRFASFNRNIRNQNTSVFEQVNDDVREFTGNTSFSAEWVMVITWENVAPFNVGNLTERNTFQVVILSDETNNYVIYNYGVIDWAADAPSSSLSLFRNQAGLPVMGWNAGSVNGVFNVNQQYQNLPGSGTVNAESIEDVMGNLGLGRWIFDMGAPMTPFPELRCFQWFGRNLPAIPRFQSRFFSCPAFRLLAFFNNFFVREINTQPNERICYVSVFPIFGPAVRCCYGINFFSSLITAPPLAGSVLSQNPLYHITEDVEGHTTCCLESTFRDVCNLYYALRPVQTSRGFLKSRAAFGFGDPHFQTLDRRNYTFNGCGDFVLVNTTNSDVQIQVQLRQSTGTDRGTIFTGVAIKYNNVPAIQVNLILGGGLLLYFNGSLRANVSEIENGPLQLGNTVVATKINNTLRIISLNNSGAVIQDERTHLLVSATLDQSLFGLTSGLMGNWSGMDTDDFLLPDGAILSSTLTDEQIHVDFGPQWAVTQNNSLFLPKMADESFNCSESYRPIFISNFTFGNTSLNATAQSICGGNTQCMFDIAATLNNEIGQQTLNNQMEIQTENNVVDNNAPEFTVEQAVLNVTLNVTFQYNVTAFDIDGDPFTIIAVQLPPGASVQQNGNSSTLSWTPNNTTAVQIEFVVTDSKGAASSLIAFINLCACENGGVCFNAQTSGINSLLNNERFNVFDCRCAPGFEGEFCRSEVDPCLTESGSPCHPQTNCTTINSTVFICGPCPPGFTGDGSNCADINECSNMNDDCDMVNGNCVNTAGSFECRCRSGFQLNGDRRTCDDINECLTGIHCQQNCTNLPGSFSCSCNENFQVDPNNAENCMPQEICIGQHACEQVCFVDQTTRLNFCSCNRGFTLQNNGVNCTDIDECSGNNNICGQLCANTPGSFGCSCIPGYNLNSDGTTCQDIDECAVSSPCNSSIGEKCFNLAGSFFCDCNNDQNLVRINGVCRVSNGSVVEPADTPRSATPSQISNSLRFRIFNFQSIQYTRGIETSFKRALADALNTYCNANITRRQECLLPGPGFTFTQLNIHRIPGNLEDVQNDTRVSFYVLYPNGTQNTSGFSVPLNVLLNAWGEELMVIQNATGLQLIIDQPVTPVTTTIPPTTDDDDVDWPLIVGVTVAGIVVLVFILVITILACARRRKNRRKSFDQPPGYLGTDGRHPGFDEDGIPVEVGGNRGSAEYNLQR